MRNAVAYYILFRVWHYCLDQSLWDALDVVAKVKSTLLAEGNMSMDAFNTATNIYRWGQGHDLEIPAETEVVTCG